MVARQNPLCRDPYQELRETIAKLHRRSFARSSGAGPAEGVEDVEGRAREMEEQSQSTGTLG
jgi:hypothetical protein